MSDKNEAPSGKANFYKNKSTEELKEMLRNSVLSDEAPEVELTNRILSELSSREDAKQRMSPEEAWDVFLADYFDTESTHLDCAFEEGTQTVPHRSDAKKQPRSLRAVIRVALVAAVIAGILVVGTITSYALGFRLWDVVVDWGRETFGFRSDEESAFVPSNNLNELQAALDEHNVTERVVPEIPDGFELVELNIDRQPNKTVFLALYIDGDKEIIVKIIELFSGPVTKYEYDTDAEDKPFNRSGDGLDLYEVDGIVHTIATNWGETIAAWVNGNLECSITGNISREEALRMIDSIYRRSNKK